MENKKQHITKKSGDNMNISELRQIKKVALLVSFIYLLKFLGIVEA